MENRPKANFLRKKIKKYISVGIALKHMVKIVIESPEISNQKAKIIHYKNTTVSGYGFIGVNPQNNQ